jgi:uncharacterized membrane protein YfcA
MTMFDRFLYTAKAWCALAGAVATALLAEFGPDGPFGGILTAIVVVTGAIVVFRVRNIDRRPSVRSRTKVRLELNDQFSEQMTAAAKAAWKRDWLRLNREPVDPTDVDTPDE